MQEKPFDGRALPWTPLWDWELTAKNIDSPAVYVYIFTLFLFSIGSI